MSQKDLDLKVTEDYLRGKITLQRLIRPQQSDRYMPLDRLLVAYAVAIALPPGVTEADRLATYQPFLEGWLTDEPLIALLRRFYPNSPTSLDWLVRLSAQRSLHSTKRISGGGVVLQLPHELVELVRRYQHLPKGGAALFYKALAS